MGRIVYLDNASSSPRTALFVERYTGWLNRPLTDEKKLELLTDLIKRLSSLLDVNPNQISLVPNCSYGLNEISNYLHSKYPDRVVYLSTSEHASNHLIWMKNFKKIDYFDPEQFSSWRIKSKPCIISLATITNLEGIEIPMEAVERKCTSGNVVVVDASQMIHFKPCELSNSKIDFLTFSGHKFFGPNGLGVVYSRDGINPGINVENFEIKKNDYELDYAGVRAWAATMEEIVPGYVTGLFQGRHMKLGKFFLENFPENKYLKIKRGNPRASIFLLELQNTTVTSKDYAFYLAKNNVIVRAGLCCAHICSERYDANKIIRVSMGIQTTEEDLETFFKFVRDFTEEACF